MITICIPAYNEEDNIKRIETELLPVMKNLNEPYEVLIINDGSRDRTKEWSVQLERKFTQIRVVDHKTNLGLGAALRTGISNSQGDIFIPLDSDFTFHPREIPKLIHRFKIGDVDCIIGSHFSEEGRTENIPFHRIFLSKTVNFLYSILLAKRIHSASSIFRLYKTDQLKQLNLFSNGFKINAEILFELVKRKKTIVEVPVVLTTRIHGVSKINNFQEIKNHAILLSEILRWKLNPRTL